MSTSLDLVGFTIIYQDLFAQYVRAATCGNFPHLRNFSTFEEPVWFIIYRLLCFFKKGHHLLFKRDIKRQIFSLSICVFKILKTKLNNNLCYFERK